MTIALAFVINAGLANAQEAPFISKSLSEETIIGPNGAVTVADAVTVSQLMGVENKVVHEIAEGVYHLRGWGIARTISIDAPAGWIIVDTGDSTNTASEMRNRLFYQGLNSWMSSWMRSLKMPITSVTGVTTKHPDPNAMNRSVLAACL